MLDRKQMDETKKYFDKIEQNRKNVISPFKK
jgi:hypothetical protein